MSENELNSIKEEDENIDILQSFIITTFDNKKIEIKYPNYNLIKETLNKSNNLLNLIKEILIKVNPKKNNNINISYCTNLLGFYINYAVNYQTNEKNIIIQGFLPNKNNKKQKILINNSNNNNNNIKYNKIPEIGDMLIEINDIKINSNNLEPLLSLIKQKQLIKLTFISPLIYLNTNINYNNLLNNKNIIKNTISKSKSTQIIQGTRIKQNNNNLNKNDLIKNNDYLCFIMILSNNKNNDKNSEISQETESSLINSFNDKVKI